jgi:hypothetical protein
LSAASRQMHLGVFVLGAGNHSAGWRWEGAAVSNNDLAVIQEIARIAEAESDANLTFRSCCETSRRSLRAPCQVADRVPKYIGEPFSRIISSHIFSLRQLLQSQTDQLSVVNKASFRQLSMSLDWCDSSSVSLRSRDRRTADRRHRTEQRKLRRTGDQAPSQSGPTPAAPPDRS